MKHYYVYILTNRSRTLYTGVTNDLVRRFYEHKRKVVPGFTAKYNLTRLVYVEETFEPRSRERSRSRAGGGRRRSR